MFNWHPPLTAFPFSFISAALLLQLLLVFWPKEILKSALRVVLIFATLGTCAAFFSGYQASDLANQTFKIADEVIARHHNFGRLLLFAMPVCLALHFFSERAKFNRTIFVTLFWISLLSCWGLATYSSYLGGQLVFVHGAGVSAVLEK